ncbi:transposase [Planctomycetota bacterium]
MMARMARIKMEGEAAAYHVYGRVCGSQGEYPLSKPLCRKTLIDVSEFMRNLHSAFGRFYNKTYGRFGRFWAARFKSTLLENTQAMLDAMLYVELNAVRAGLVQCPEDWKGGSRYLREAGQDDWRMPLTALLALLAKYCRYQSVMVRAIMRILT